MLTIINFIETSTLILSLFNPPPLDKIKDKFNPVVTEYTIKLEQNYEFCNFELSLKTALAKMNNYANGPRTKNTITFKLKKEI